MNLADIPVPATAAAAAAVGVVEAFSSPALVNHAQRSYVFAAALAASTGLPIDHELLYVATMLHDLGLEDAFDNHRLPFEHAGGHLAWVFAAGAGWPVSRRARAAEIVVGHMLDDLDPDLTPEAYALAAGTSLDISGSQADRWPASLLRQAVAVYPRHDLASRFVACFQDQAERKPASSAATAVRGDLAHRAMTNLLDRL